ncbi:MAG TPA: bifunctional riboflavin kinase/FAD synthetase [Acidimicrobiales bacterium]
MEVIRDQASCPRPAGGCVVTIGAYDGVHLGHRALIDEVKQRATHLGSATAVVTFDRHPATVVRPDSAPLVLTDLDQKLELLDSTGIDYALVLTFDDRRAREPAEAFVTGVLVDCLAARAVVVGHDFHFGHNRRGNVQMLTSMGSEYGFDVLGLTLLAQGREPVSSTRIRRLLADGEVEEAALLLGRPHEVRGRVVAGDGRARDWQFPTANIDVAPDVCLPADGIYAGWYQRPDRTVLAAAISLGTRPTFYERAERSLLEAHLLDFAEDLYGEPARVRFVRRLRREEKFGSEGELVEQIRRDVEETRRVLAR